MTRRDRSSRGLAYAMGLTLMAVGSLAAHALVYVAEAARPARSVSLQLPLGGGR